MKKKQILSTIICISMIFMLCSYSNKADPQPSNETSSQTGASIQTNENLNSEKEQTQSQSENETYNSKSTNENTKSYTYIANNHTLKFHRPNCRSVKQMNDENKIYLNCTRADAINRGYEPCKHCEP